ncbi:MAG: hypothetical protein EOR04_16655 [Mesorhizobium sp.]|uniref:hypothetical protein n=1 Tax=Mesorhizobium sp. TaxID=1871066 RepID=UPI000FE5940F|nr:hypothetical protein [Mesorhizobium sp.]RWP41071.1 MAG: hypothetical protein EOR04_16655 [Mesorhizobium sp.]
MAFFDCPLSTKAPQLDRRQGQNLPDNASATLIPNPLCTGIVYHRINRLWSEPGEIVAQAAPAIAVNNHGVSSFGAALLVLLKPRRQAPVPCPWQEPATAG